jgi:hypothetical protein
LIQVNDFHSNSQLWASSRGKRDSLVEQWSTLDADKRRCLTSYLLFSTGFHLSRDECYSGFDFHHEDIRRDSFTSRERGETTCNPHLSLGPGFGQDLGL